MKKEKKTKGVDYALQELKNYSRIMRGSVNTESISPLYEEAAVCLENQTLTQYDHEVVEFLEELRLRIKHGLDSWGKNFQKEKKRQQNKLNEVDTAIRLMKANNDVMDGLRGLGEHMNTWEKHK